MQSGKNPLMLMMALSVPGAAHAIGLGDIHVDSALNENFAAEIDIVGATALELTDLRASLANRETFLRYGADRPAFLSSATFKVVQDSHGRAVLAVRSSESFTEPVVNFLVDLNWHNGELVRQYTVLLDPADYAHSLKTQLAIEVPAASPAVTATATVAAESTADANPAAVAAPAAVATPPAVAEAPTVSSTPTRKMTHIKVGAKATLRGIAWRVGERTQSDLQKMMIAIFRANPTAFDNNINRLHRGALLTIPAHAELAAISKAEASNEVRAQMAAWRSGARLVASSTAQPAPAAESTTVPEQSTPEVLDRRVKSLEQELNESNKALHSTDAQLQSLLEKAARDAKPAVAVKPVLAQKPILAAAVLAAAPHPRIKSDFTALSIAGGLGLLGTALAALYFRMRRRTLPPQPSSVGINAGSDTNAIAAVGSAEDLAETLPNVEPLQAQQSAKAPTHRPVQEYTPIAASGDTRPDLQAILEPRRDESTQPLLPIISAGEPAARSSIASGSFSRVAPQDVTVNMRADRGTVRLDTTPLDYNLLDLDMTAQHVQMPSVLNEQVVMKERRTNLADVLKLAIEREPDRHDLRLKLLELYYSAASTNRQAFLEVVQKFARERHHLPADEWERIASMGRQIASENPMFVDESLLETDDDDLADCA
ncbi:MAG: FimV/HubP family polar landmark protein [Gammaproteobacteria bacterium]